MRHVTLYAREWARTGWSMPREMLVAHLELLLTEVVVAARAATEVQVTEAIDPDAVLPAEEPDPPSPHAYALMDDMEKLRRDCAFEARRADEWARKHADLERVHEAMLSERGELQDALEIATAKLGECEGRLAQTQAELRRAMHAHLIIARAKADPKCEYFYCEETTSTRATYVTKSRDNPKETRLTYTIEDARRAELVKPKSNWEKRPAEMLRKTAGVQLARLEYPGTSIGVYAVDELEG